MTRHKEETMVTMEVVAAAAGVSTTTVSHVINKTRKVHPDTERAVLDAIEKVGYSANHLARALAGAPTRTVGVAISALSNHYFAAVVSAIESECSKSGLMMLLADTHEDPAFELGVVKALHERRVDGILIAPTADPESRTLNYLHSKGVPTVLVDRFMGTTFDQVAVENLQSAKSLVAHLVGLGHRRIAFISGAPGLSTTDERLKGYRLALEEAGLEFQPDLVRSGGSQIAPARAAVQALLSLNPRPTAIMTGNNLMTIGAMHALRDAGLQVPADISLVGFDDFDWADVLTPRLTVIAQPVEELGARAVRLLVRRIANPTARRQSLRLAPALRLRDSAGPV
ncbi:ribose operon repressor [Comamonadaceae bacterium OS-1]|nr:ribose operon repressor [Comamonadaceae bacterium OS-1]